MQQVGKLVHERGQVADKIVSIESALNSIRENLSAAAQQGARDPRPLIETGKTAVKEEQSYDRLLRALEDMKAQIENHVRPVAEQVVQAEVERLRDLSERHKDALEECLSQIDESILDCRAHVDAYRESCADLMTINQRLAKLGAEPVPFPEQIPAANFDDVIKSRVEGLEAEGKI